jgi:6-phosphogluconolactonase
MKRNIRIFDDRASLVAEAMRLCLASAQASVRFTIALAGGSTPKPLYQALAESPAEWDRWHIFFGDERFVPHSDPQSNYKMAKEVWLDRVAIPPAQIYPIPTDGDDPAVVSQRYEQVLQDFWGIDPGAFPAIDVVLLGMGDDGHTASLFPFTPALAVHDRLVTVGYKDSQPRITLTVPTINHAQQVIFLVEGGAKAKALSAVLAETGDDQQYPARLIKDEAIWLVDRAAAQLLGSDVLQ